MRTSSLSAPAAVTESASSSRPLMCIDGEQVKLQSRPEQSPTQQQPLPECTVAPQDASAVPSRVECHPGFRLVRNGQSNASAIASSLTFSGSRLVKKDWYFCSESKMRAAATLLVTHHNSTKCPPPPRWESLPRGQVWQHAHDVCLYGDSMMDQFFSALQGKLLASGEIKQRIVEQSYNWTRAGYGLIPARYQLRTTTEATIRYIYTSSADKLRDTYHQEHVNLSRQLRYGLPTVLCDMRHPFNVSILEAHCGTDASALVLGMGTSHCNGVSRHAVLRAQAVAADYRARQLMSRAGRAPARTFLLATQRPMYAAAIQTERSVATAPGSTLELIDTSVGVIANRAGMPVQADRAHFCLPGLPDLFVDLWASQLLS